MATLPSDLLKIPRLAGTRIAGVYLLIVIAYIAAALFLGMSERRRDGFMLVMVMTVFYVTLYSALAWGCLRRNRFAYWISVVFLSIESFFFLKELPDTLRFIWDIALKVANSLESIGFYSDFYPVVFFYMTFIIGVLKTFALILLLLRSSRKAFGIGRFAAHRIQSHDSH